jgi:hypothetical protein
VDRLFASLITFLRLDPFAFLIGLARVSAPLTLGVVVRILVSVTYHASLLSHD